MDELLVVGKMNLLVDFQLFLAVESLRASRAHEEWFIARLGVDFLAMIVERLLVGIRFVTELAAERVFASAPLSI